MPLALILSSYVAASRVGGAAQQYTLAPFGIDPVLVPTVLFGRSPAKGAPGGAAVAAETFAALLAGVEAEGLFGLADLVITGHFSLPEQVEQAALTIEKVRAAPREGAFSPRPRIIVDPILGDDPKGLYVKPEVAEAVATRLVPLADWLTPNAWELAHLTGRPIGNPADAASAARALGKPCLVSSVPVGLGRIGLVCHDGHFARLYTHERLASAPNGTGDLVTAVFAAQLLLGVAPLVAAEGAARTVLEAVRAAAAWNAPDLPLVALGESLVRPSAQVAIEDLP
jgi:pyridoxine kinase